LLSLWTFTALEQYTQCTHNRNIGARARVCVALVIQHALRMRRIILSSVACLAVQYFSTLSHKRHDFQKNVIEHKMCVLSFSTTFVWNTSHSRKNSARYYHKCTWVFMSSSRYCCHMLIKLIFSTVSKIPEISNFTKIRPVGGEMFREDGRTDMSKLIVAFRTFANAPNELNA
jgi:hypothetical protein